VNDAPVITVPSSPQSAVEDQPRLITGISLADVDLTETTSDPAGTGSGQLTVTLSAGRGTIDLSDIVPPGVTVANDGSQSVIVSGLLADVNTLLGAGITYQGLPYLNGNDTVTVTANDLGNWPPPARVSTASFVVAVVPVNNPPVISAPGEQLVNEDSPHTFPSIAVTDVDVADGTNQLKVDLQVSHGTLTLDLTVSGGLQPADVTGNGTSHIAIDKVSPGKINATLSALSGLTYRPALNYNGPDVLTIVADDKGNTGGAVTPTTVAVPIAIAAVNDAPQLPWSVPPGVAPAPLTSEDVPVHIKWPANPVVDVDVSESPGDGRLTVTLSASHGTLTVSTNYGLTSGDFNGSNSGGTVEFTAPLAAINATLSAATGVQYAPNLNYNGKDTVVVTVNDRGNTDAGLMNPLTARGTVTVTVVAVNDPPVITVPAASVTVDEDTDLPLQVQVTDVDAAEGTGELQMTLQVFRGTLTVDTAVSGGVGAGGVTGNGTTAISLVGTQQQLNATFAAGGVVYRGNLNYFTTNPGDEILLIQARDEANGVDNKTVTITINPINDAPTININPPAQIIEDTAVALQIAVNDAEMNVPIGANVIWTVSLHADQGTFTVLPGIAGGVPAWGIAGSGSGHVVLTGTGRQIQTTLAAPNAVGFQGVKDFAGTDILSMTILDPGPTASPADDQISSATLTYTISGVNDAPEIALPAGLTTPEDVALPLSGPGGVSVSDVDSDAANISVVLQVVNGKLTVGGSVPAGLNVAGSGTSKLTLVGPVAAIGTLLADPDGLKYTGNLNYFGPDTLVVSADDRGNSGEGGTKTATQSTAINVTPVNDPPVVAKPVADFSVDEDSPDTLIELFPGVFEDPDNTSLTLTVTSNSDPSLVATTITGTRLTLDYQPNQGGRSSIIRVRASDGLAFAEDEFVVTVNPLPDPPFVANPVPDQVVQLGSTTTVTVDLSAVFDDFDLPHDVLTLSYNNSTDNTNPTLVTSGTLIGQTLTLQLAAGRFGRADITVRATDSTGKSASDTFGVIVNSRPTANHDTATTKEDVAVAIPVVNNDRDVDGVIDPSTVTIVAGSGPANGRIVSIIGGIVTYEPNANFWGTDSFQYTVNDNDGFVSQPATVTITVQAVADFQNPFLNADVNKSGAVSPIDALIAINYINGPTGGVLPPDPTPPATPQFYYDVNGDGKCDAADVLAIVNILNAAASAGGEGEAAETSVPTMTESVPPLHTGLSAAWLALPDYT
ncbi:MAG TPA: Ig-like domain-containing protein, partial [Candidatus Anammoximicrobium sp.]|nr:Ig-like domain-containing protein [Candidatus Anammoximicrobium sp.]